MLRIAATEIALRRSLTSKTSSTPVDAEHQKEKDSDTTTWDKIYRGGITKSHLEEISRELGLIQLCWDHVTIDFSSRSQWTKSYWCNTNKEKLVLWYAENFRSQFQHRFPKRRPLLLACANECGLQKMVCTTIRPTSLRYPELQTWEGCASFVSAHIKYKPLAQPSLLPEQLLSPGEVLIRQNGNSFEMATLLVSLLIGASYDAYVVSGFATREVCNNDMTRYDCPYLLNEQKEEKIKDSEPPSIYELEPPRDLRSQFLLRMEEREKAREIEARQAQALIEERAIQEYEKPPPDTLKTHRRHAWVLILPSKDVTEACFIESTSGVRKYTNDIEYHGIDSLWNHFNYWVSVGQDRLIPPESLLYDLDDLSCWEHFLIGEPASYFKTPIPQDMDIEEAERLLAMGEKHVDMPATWVKKIRLSHAEFERKYVDCLKTIQYRKCIADLFSPYSDPAGLSIRVRHFTDYECTDLCESREQFEHRSDLLYFSCTKGNSIHHRFRRGRSDALKEHWYELSSESLPTVMRFEFYHQARMDNILRLTMDSNSMMEEFSEREDHLYKRVILFDAKSHSDRPILTITEYYERDSSKSVFEDVAILEFNLREEKVCIRYQYAEENITAGTRELCLKNMKQLAAYDPVPGSPAPRPLALYRWLRNYSDAAKAAVAAVRQRQSEVEECIIKRSLEMASPVLKISPFDEERNQEAKQEYKERDRKIQEAQERDLSLTVDLLTPYLAELPPSAPLPLPSSHASMVYVKCLKDWKDMLIARASDIQQQFDQLSQQLSDWRKSKTEDADVSDDRLKDYRFKLHCLEVRLERFKQLAPQQYLSVDACLHADSRLKNAF